MRYLLSSLVAVVVLFSATLGHSDAIDLHDSLLGLEVRMDAHFLAQNQVVEPVFSCIDEVNASRKAGQSSLQTHAALVSRCRQDTLLQPLRAHTGVDDSALYTGIYLGAECLHLIDLLRAQQVSDFYVSAVESDLQKTRARITRLLDGVDRMFEATGTPGLPARFVRPDSATGAFAILASDNSPIELTDKLLQSNPLGDPTEEHDRLALRKQGWRMSQNLPSVAFLGDTSRDQYVGLFFGLGVCANEAIDPELENRARNRVASTVHALSANGWKIPTGPYDFGRDLNGFRKITGTLKLAWLQLGALADPTLQSEYDRETDHGRGGLNGRWNEPTELNNFYEYYAWNHRFLAYFTLLKYENYAARRKGLEHIFMSKLWRQVRSHRNAEFNFTAFGQVDSLYDTSSKSTEIDDAKIDLTELIEMPRRNFGPGVALDPNAYRAIPRDPIINDIRRLAGALAHLFRIPNLGDFEHMPDRAVNPLPIRIRPSTQYFWQQDPRELPATGFGEIENPPLDAIVAYWMGVDGNQIFWRRKLDSEFKIPSARDTHQK